MLILHESRNPEIALYDYIGIIKTLHNALEFHSAIKAMILEGKMDKSVKPS